MTINIKEMRNTTDYTYIKQVNVRKLYKELITNDYIVNGISFDPTNKKLIISIDPTDQKDPTSIVDAHIYRPDKPIDFQKEWSKAITIDDKLLVIAKYAKFINLTDTDFQNGGIL